MEFVALCPEHTAEASVPLLSGLLAHPSSRNQSEIYFDIFHSKYAENGLFQIL